MSVMASDPSKRLQIYQIYQIARVFYRHLTSNKKFQKLDVRLAERYPISYHPVGRGQDNKFSFLAIRTIQTSYPPMGERGPIPNTPKRNHQTESGRSNDDRERNDGE